MYIFCFRKLLKEKLKSFKNLTESDIEDIIPKLEVVYCIKLILADDKIVPVYTLKKVPIVFELQDILYPTLYLLWKHPNIVVTLTTVPHVVPKIYSGADLMIPGVVTNPSFAETFVENEIVCINSIGNKIPVAVGFATLSSDQLKKQTKGKCVVILHFYNDKLCSLGNACVIPLSNLGAPDWYVCPVNDDVNFPPLGKYCSNKSGNTTKEEMFNIKGNKSNRYCLTDDSSSELFNQQSDVEVCKYDIEKDDDIKDARSSEFDMDELLKYCFLTAIKYSKSLKLPVLTSAFYRLEILPICPEGRSLDIKKTSYKKFGKFLNEVANVRIVDLETYIE